MRRKLLTVLVVARVAANHDEPAALAAYVSATGPLLIEAGAKILHEYRLGEPVVGANASEAIVVVEYPSRAAVDLVFESKVYKDIIPTRDRAFLVYETSIATENV